MKIKLIISFGLGCLTTFLVFAFMYNLVHVQESEMAKGIEFSILDKGPICSFPIFPTTSIVEESCSCWYLGEGEGKKYRGLGGGCDALTLDHEDLGVLPKCGSI
ncbi:MULTISPECIES: hypothetical protein [unclassified Microbulbifer]|uniref:hypothetical protein n=1 Tax=unclassified Microbulbifer TaxID=2619833 RepID=UPI0027E458AB|nr:MULTISPECIES: hypothetical protein [unclassified Microbulbifer]